MQQGHDDAQIKQFLVARYGEFVLYQPPLQPGWLLWGGLLVLGAGAGGAGHRPPTWTHRRRGASRQGR